MEDAKAKSKIDSQTADVATQSTLYRKGSRTISPVLTSSQQAAKAQGCLGEELPKGSENFERKNARAANVSRLHKLLLGRCQI